MRRLRHADAQFNADPLTGCGPRLPITIAREVHRGRCLFSCPESFSSTAIPTATRTACHHPKRIIFTKQLLLIFSFYDVPTASSPPSRRLPHGNFTALPINGYSILSAHIAINSFDIVDIVGHETPLTIWWYKKRDASVFGFSRGRK
jgi:hypothetical protein